MSADTETCRTAAAATAASETTTHSSQLLFYLLCLWSFPTIFYVVSYLIPQIYMAFFRPVPNLKARYYEISSTTTTTFDQTPAWALVTGAGSGIGRSLCFGLARQGFHVVLVSLEDDFLKATVQALQTTFPQLKFLVVGVNFAPGVKYMDAIDKVCHELDIRVVFSNAGFMVTGFMDQAPIGKLLTNVECNATACLNVGHYFVQKWVSRRQKACLVFTSSVAGFIPTPFAVSYASTKAFVSQLAASMHIECAPLGIDVCAIHPSPVASNFYSQLDHKVDMIEAAAQSAVTPDSVVNDIFKSIGVCAYRDLGTLAWATRLGTFFIPYNLFSEMFATFAPLMPDWKTHNKNR